MNQAQHELRLLIPQQTAEALTTLAAEAGFTDLSTYLIFRIDADLKDWRFHLDDGDGLPSCSDQEGRPAPKDVFWAFPPEKTCPNCRTIAQPSAA